VDAIKSHPKVAVSRREEQSMTTAPRAERAATAAQPEARSTHHRIDNHYRNGGYWRNRMDLMYYGYVDYIMRTVARGASSMIDIGTANCPYLEWFDWIGDRVSFDLETPYASSRVQGIRGDFLDHRFDRRFDVCTCLQVLEHIPDVERFARKLLTMADTLVLSVPYLWNAGAAEDHLHDPIDLEKLTLWMGREPNYHLVVQEPFRGKVGQRLIAIYDRDAAKGYGRNDFRHRIRRTGLGPGGRAMDLAD
jgi:hypothetical protein